MSHQMMPSMCNTKSYHLLEEMMSQHVPSIILCNNKSYRLLEDVMSHYILSTCNNTSYHLLLALMLHHMPSIPSAVGTDITPHAILM